MNLRGVRWLSFDCYGTLVDWETGILRAAGEVLRARCVRVERRAGDDARARARLLALFAAAEREVEAGPYRPYREVLAEVMARLGHACGLELGPEERARLPASLPDWPLFEDTAPALRALRMAGGTPASQGTRRFRLAVLSNVDEDLFEGTRSRLRAAGADVDLVVTAQSVGSYKPSAANFRELLRRTGAAAAEIVHVAESPYHDIAPAGAMGLRTVWVRRRHGAEGEPRASGAAAEGSSPRADAVVADLAELVRMVG